MTGKRNHYLKGWYLSFLLLNNSLNYVVLFVYMCSDVSVDRFNFNSELIRSHLFIKMTLQTWINRTVTLQDALGCPPPPPRRHVTCTLHRSPWPKFLPSTCWPEGGLQLFKPDRAERRTPGHHGAVAAGQLAHFDDSRPVWQTGWAGKGLAVWESIPLTAGSSTWGTGCWRILLSTTSPPVPKQNLGGGCLTLFYLWQFAFL